jgi:hypothetical protein
MTGRLGFVVSHPSDKNNDVARMGHPLFVPVQNRLADNYECQVLSFEWQSCSRLQTLHLGLRAMQTWRP